MRFFKYNSGKTDRNEFFFKKGSTILPEQFNPFPSKPCLQEQLNDPSVLLHVALFPHGDDRHSLTSTIINVGE